MTATTDTRPLISVVIPSYNRAHLLPKAINSILLQDISSLEIVIADDGSEDNTEQLVKELSLPHPKVVYVKNACNGGESSARNLGVRHARGQFIAFLDSDDEWLPGKLKLQLDFLEKNFEKYDGVTVNYFLVDEQQHKNPINYWHSTKELSSLNLLKYGCGVGFGSTSILKRSSFDKIGFFDEHLPIFVDLDWLCRFLDAGLKITCLKDFLVLYNKSPMRKGEFLEAGVKAYKEKNRLILLQYSFYNRMCIESQFLNYVSHAYLPNGPFRKFFWSRLKHFAFNPFQPISNYWHLLKVTIQHFLSKG